MTQLIDRFFAAISDEYHCLDRFVSRLLQRMAQDATDLGNASYAAYPTHQLQQLAGLRDERRGLEFTEAPVIAQLDRQPAQILRRKEELALQITRLIPGSLSTGRGIQGEYQPPLAAGRSG